MFSENQWHASLLKNGAVLHHLELWSFNYVVFNYIATWAGGLLGEAKFRNMSKKKGKVTEQRKMLFLINDVRK